MVKSICIILGLSLFQESSYIIRKKTGRTRGNKQAPIVITGKKMKHISESRVKTHIYIVEWTRKAILLTSFFKIALKCNHNQHPRIITTDKYPATEITIIEEIYLGDLNCRMQYRMNQYLNNIIEQDHRFIKKKINPMLGFKIYDTATKTISGIEAMHIIHKEQIEEVQCV